LLAFYEVGVNKIYSLMNDLNRGRLLADDLAKSAGLVSIDEIRNRARRAVCFDFGEADALSQIKPLDDVRLPFPVVWVEFDAIVYSDKTKDESRMRCAVLLEERDNGARYDGYTFLWNGHHWKYLWLFIGKRNCSDWTTTYLPDFGETATQDYPFGVVFRGCSVMKCANINIEEERPSKLVAMRAKKRKLPLFSTWTLHIKQSAHESRNLGGTHASPRVHLRRGHVRQYSPGMFTWVQPCVVGKKELGIIHKDYALAR